MFLSPWGIAHALAMVLQGAREGSDTQTQLLSIVYGSPAGAAAVRSAVQSLTTTLTSASSSKDQDSALTVSDANSAWVKADVALTEAYKTALKEFFAAQAGPLNSAAEVNAWVSDHTHGKITEIIDEGTAKQAALILVNAIYFKGIFEKAFGESDTAPLSFTMMDGTSMDAAMMYLHLKKGNAVSGARFSAGGGDCVAVKMAYQGGAYVAVAAMPHGELAPADGGPLKLADGRDYAAALAACREGMIGGSKPLEYKTIGDPAITAVKLYLPRFEVEFGAGLSDALKAMGLRSMFVPGDFTEMTAEGDLVVSDVVHKTYVKVDEKGTEAAAATAVVMLRAAFRPEPELFVKFDRPFAFAVVHESTGLALFVGDVYQPERWLKIIRCIAPPTLFPLSTE
jgi:serpin B